MNKNIFREKALANISSPEKLDEKIKLISPQLWIGLCAILMMIFIACIWGWFGRIETKINGTGILMNEGMVRSLAAQASGTVKSINVDEGNKVEQNEVLGVIDQPLLELEIRQLMDKYLYLQEQFDKLFAEENKNIKLREDYFKNVGNTADSTIKKLTDIQGYLKEISDIYKNLREKGISSKVEFYQMMQNAINSEVNVSSQLGQKYKLPVEQSDFMISQNKAVYERLKEIKLTLESLEIKRMEYISKALLVSPVAGKVVSVIKSPGDPVTQGESMFTIIPTAVNSMIVTAYFSIKDWKQLDLNQLAYISLTNMPPQRYGYMLGLVREISHYPMTEAGLESDFKNKELIKFFKSSGDILISVNIELIPDSTNWTGVRWTSKAVEDQYIDVASPCNVMVVVEKRPPISYVIPWIKKTFFGVGAN